MNVYYVYALLDPRIEGNFDYGDFKFSFKPFYVGKGHGNRVNDHLYSLNGNLPKTNQIRKILSLGLKPIVEKIYVDLEEKESYKKEINVIKIIGLKNLTNVLSGGNGVCREDILGEKNPMFGKKRPKELIAKIQKARKPSLSKYKGCKLEEILGELGAKIAKDKQSKVRKGKSWEEYFGKEKAKAAKENLIKRRKGSKHTEETLLKMRKSAKTRDNSNRKSEAMARWEERRNAVFKKRELILKLHNKGQSIQNISKTTGISRYYVKQILCHM